MRSTITTCPSLLSDTLWWESTRTTYPSLLSDTLWWESTNTTCPSLLSDTLWWETTKTTYPSLLSDTLWWDSQKLTYPSFLSNTLWWDSTKTTYLSLLSDTLWWESKKTICPPRPFHSLCPTKKPGANRVGNIIFCIWLCGLIGRGRHGKKKRIENKEAGKNKDMLLYNMLRMGVSSWMHCCQVVYF